MHPYKRASLVIGAFLLATLLLLGPVITTSEVSSIGHETQEPSSLIQDSVKTPLENETKPPYENFTRVFWDVWNYSESYEWSWRDIGWEFGPFARFDLYYYNGSEITPDRWVPLGDPIIINVTVPKSLFEENCTLGRVEIRFELWTPNFTVFIQVVYDAIYEPHWSTYSSITNYTSGMPEYYNWILFFLNVTESNYFEDDQTYYVKFVGEFNTSTPIGLYTVCMDIRDNAGNHISNWGLSSWIAGYEPCRTYPIGAPREEVEYHYFRGTFRFIKKDLEGNLLLTVARNQPFIFQFNVSVDVSLVIVRLRIPDIVLRRNVTGWHSELVKHKGGWVWNETTGTYEWNENVTFYVSEWVYGPYEIEEWFGAEGLEVNVTYWQWIYNETTGKTEPVLVNETWWVPYEVLLVYNASTDSFEAYLGYSYWGAVDENDPELGNRDIFVFVSPLNESDEKFHIYQLLKDECSVEDAPFGKIINFVGYFTEKMPKRDYYWIDYRVYDTEGREVYEDWVWKEGHGGYEMINKLAIEYPIACVKIKGAKERWWFQVDPGDWFIIQAELTGSSEIIDDIDGMKIILRSYNYWERENETYWSESEIILIIDYLQNTTSYEAYNRTYKSVWEYGEYEFWNETSGDWETTVGWHWEQYMYNHSSGEWAKSWLPWHGDETRVSEVYLEITNFTRYEDVAGTWIFEANVTLTDRMPENSYQFKVYFTNWTYGEDPDTPYGEHEVLTWVKELVYSFEDNEGHRIFVERPDKAYYVTDNRGRRYRIEERPYIIIGDEKLTIKPREFWNPVTGRFYYDLLRWDHWDPELEEGIYYYLLENGTKISVYPGYAGYVYNWTFPDLGINVLSPSKWLYSDHRTDKYYIFLLNGSVLSFDEWPYYEEPVDLNVTIELEYAGWAILVNGSFILRLQKPIQWDPEVGKHFIVLENGTEIYLEYWEDPYWSYYFERNGKIYFVDWSMKYFEGTYDGDTVIIYDRDVQRYYYTEIGEERYILPAPGVRVYGWWDLNRPEPEGKVPVDKYVLYNGSLYLLMYDNSTGEDRLFIETENGTVYFKERRMDNLTRGWWALIRGHEYWLEHVGDRIPYGDFSDAWLQHFNVVGYLDVALVNWTEIGYYDGVKVYEVHLINSTVIYVNRTRFLWIFKLNYSGETYYVKRPLPRYESYENGTKYIFELLNGSELEVIGRYKIVEAIRIRIGANKTFTFNGKTYDLTTDDWFLNDYYYIEKNGREYIVGKFDEIEMDMHNGYKFEIPKIFNVTYKGETYMIYGEPGWILRKAKIWGRVYGWHHERLKIGVFMRTHELIVGEPEWGMWGFRAWTVDPETGALDLDGDLSTTDDRFYVKRVYVGTYHFNFTANGMFVSLLWEPNVSQPFDELNMNAWMGVSTHYWKYTWNETYYWYYAENMSSVSRETMDMIRSTILDEEGNPKPGYWEIAMMVENRSWEDILEMAREKGWDWISDEYQSWTWIWFGFEQFYHASWHENNTDQWAYIALRYEYAGLYIFNDTNGDGIMDENEITHYFMPNSVENITFMTPGEPFGNYNRTGEIIVPGDEEISFGIIYDSINGTTFPADHSIWWWYGGEALSGSDFNTFNTRPVDVSIDFMMFKLHFQGNLTADELGNREAYIKIDQYVGDWDVMLSRGREVLENRSLSISYYVYLETSMHWSVYSEEGTPLTNEQVAEASRIRIGAEDVSFAEIVLGDQYLWGYNYTMHDATAQTTPLCTYESIYVGYDSPTSATGWTFRSTMYFLTVGFPLWDGYAVYQDPLEIINVGHRGEEVQPVDSDGDGIPDQWEIDHKLNPRDPNDALEDPDNDGLNNLGEYLHNTDPWNPDTDNDSMPDGWEVDHAFDPNDPSDAEGDADNDGLINKDEYRYDTDPWDPDTDDDGYTDKEEIDSGTDPRDPGDHPTGPAPQPQPQPPPTPGGIQDYIWIIAIAGIAVVGIIVAVVYIKRR